MEANALERGDIPVFRRRPRRIDLDLSKATLQKSIWTIRRAGTSG
jgi:hypothetical protein